MPHKQTQIAQIVLILVTLCGLIPAAFIVYNRVSGGSASIAQWLAHPALPAVFMLLFAFGAGVSIYLAKRWFLLLLLPLLYLGLLPLFTASAHDQPQIFYGRTSPGAGFVPYKNQGWSIHVSYPESIAQVLQGIEKDPVIFVSVGGKSGHWNAVGSNSIYPHKKLGGLKQGFTLNFADRVHAAKNKADPELPKKGKWFVSYIVLIPED